MQNSTRIFCVAAAAAILAACSGNATAPSGQSLPNTGGAAQSSSRLNAPFVPHWSPLASLIPAELRPAGVFGLHGNAAPPKVLKTGIYASTFFYSTIYG